MINIGLQKVKKQKIKLILIIQSCDQELNENNSKKSLTKKSFMNNFGDLTLLHLVGTNNTVMFTNQLIN